MSTPPRSFPTTTISSSRSLRPMDHSISSPESAGSFRSCYSSFRSLEQSDSYREGDPYMQIEEIPSDLIGCNSSSSDSFRRCNSSSSSSRSLLHSESYYLHDPYMFQNMQWEEIPSSFRSDNSSISRISSRRAEAAFSVVLDAHTDELRELSELYNSVYMLRLKNQERLRDDHKFLSTLVDHWFGSVHATFRKEMALQNGRRAKMLSFFRWSKKIVVPNQPKKSILDLKKQGIMLENLLKDKPKVHGFDIHGHDTNDDARSAIRESVKDHSRIGIIGMGRSAKSILEKILASEDSEIGVFDVVIWLTISYDYGIPTARRIQDDVATRLNLSLDENDSTKARATALFDALSKIRFLLVLDNLHGLKDLSTIGIPQCNAHNRCVMVITSSPKDVCEAMGASKIIEGL